MSGRKSIFPTFSDADGAIETKFDSVNEISLAIPLKRTKLMSEKLTISFAHLVNQANIQAHQSLRRRLNPVDR